MKYKLLNPVFFLFLALTAALFFLFDAILRRTRESRERVFRLLCFLPLATFVIYKTAISFDPAYIGYYYNGTQVNYWEELPLYPCTIAMILLPISVIRQNKALCGAMSVAGISGGIFTFLSPYGFMLEHPFTRLTVFLYFLEHILLLDVCALVIKYGKADMKFSEIPKHTVINLLLIAGVGVINVLLRATGLYPTANYCFTHGLEGNPVMDCFYALLPVPFVFPIVVGTILSALFDVIITLVTAGRTAKRDVPS